MDDPVLWIICGMPVAGLLGLIGALAAERWALRRIAQSVWPAPVRHRRFSRDDARAEM